MNITIDSPKTFNFQRRATTQEERIELMTKIDPKGFYPSGPPREWVVDDMHQIKFIALGGRGSMPEETDYMPDFYQLLIGKQVVRLEVRYTYVPDTLERHINYKVLLATAPRQLVEQSDFLKKAILEGLLANEYSMNLKYNPRGLVTAIEINNFEFNFV